MDVADFSARLKLLLDGFVGRPNTDVNRYCIRSSIIELVHDVVAADELQAIQFDTVSGPEPDQMVILPRTIFTALLFMGIYEPASIDHATWETDEFELEVSVNVRKKR